MLTFLNSRYQEKNARVFSMKKTLPFKTIKKIALVDTRPDLYLILRFLCVPLDEAHVPLVVRVPHFENRCSRPKSVELRQAASEPNSAFKN